MASHIARANPKLRNPSLAHLRQVVIDILRDVPESPRSRYEEDLYNFTRKSYRVMLGGRLIYFDKDTNAKLNVEENRDE